MSYGAFYEASTFGLTNGVMTFTQTLTLFLVGLLLERLGVISSTKTNIVTDLVIIGTLYLLNWYRYSKVMTLDKMENKWGEQSKSSKTIGSILTGVYVLGTLTATLYLTGFFK